MKLILLLLVLSLNVYGHGDHSIPGMLPIAPHGGVMTEASHTHTASHQHEQGEQDKEKEVFFEAKIKNDILFFYVLELGSEGNSFKTLNSSELSSVKVSLFDPRRKLTYNPQLVKGTQEFKSSLSKIKARRFLLNISLKYKGRNFTGTVQVEKK